MNPNFLKLKALKLAECDGKFSEDLMEPGGPDGNWYAEESIVGERVLVDLRDLQVYDRSLQPIGKSLVGEPVIGMLDTVVDGKVHQNFGVFLFDVLLFKGKDVRAEPLIRRRRYLRQIIDTLRGAGHVYPEMVPNVTLLGLSHKQLLEKCLKEGKPGIILKDLTSTYGQKDSWVAVDRKGGHC